MAESKILVTYGSWCGSTAEVAEAIAHTLTAAGLIAEVKAAKEVRNITGFNAVIIGTAIRAGRCVGSVQKLVNKYHNELLNIPTAFFSVGLQMTEDTEENRIQAKKFLEPLLQELSPVSIGLFGGKVDATKSSFPMSFIMRKLPQGDWRDWNAINAWADSLVPLLRKA